jgi:hypothetical protein
MEKIIVNQDARQSEIDTQVIIALNQIKANAEQGIATTELYIPKHVGPSVRDKITVTLKASNTRFDWLVVKTGRNQYTGGVEHFSSDTIGDNKYYKLKIQ